MLQRTLRVIPRLSLLTTRHVSGATLAARSTVRNPMLNNVRLARMLHSQPSLYNNIAVANAEQVVVEEVIETKEVAPKRFDEIEAIHPLTQRALKNVFRYQTMSTVQEAVVTRMPNTNDMFVKAKTGTGKTLAFLIAALENVVAGKSKEDLRHFDGSSIFIVSPTRELAHQIAEEATKLTKFYPLNVHCFVGGESKFKQIKGMERSRCDIVVGTPGRLNDLLESHTHFRKMVGSTKVLVLDEADQLVDMGFKAEVERILRHLPKERQSMLFSATLSDDVRGTIGKFALSPKYDLIDTVGEEDVNTHLHVKQSALVAPYNEQVPLIRNLLDTYDAAKVGKTIVFLPTTKSTMLYADLFKYLLPRRKVFELHSRKSQDQRSRISSQFKKAKEGSILFTSDVSARGVDYPGVSLVLQVGVPSSREQYIHRLGRTGRAGNAGEGIIVTAPFEDAFIKTEIGDLPVESLVAPEISMDEQEETKRILDYFTENRLDPEMTREVYTSYLGYYVGRMIALTGRRSDTLEHGEAFLRSFGVEEIPHLSPRFIQQVGLSEKPDRRSSRGDNDRFNRRSGGFGGRFDDRRSRFPRHDRTDNRESRGSFGERGNFEQRGRFENRGRFEQRDRSESRGRFEQRDRSENRGRFEPRDRSENRGRFERNDRFGQKNRFEPRDRFERSDRSDHGEKRNNFRD